MLWVFRSGEKKEEKVGKMPPLDSCWSQPKQENLGSRGKTDGYTVGPTVAHSWELGPRGSLEPQLERAFVSVLAKCGVWCVWHLLGGKRLV